MQKAEILQHPVHETGREKATEREKTRHKELATRGLQGDWRKPNEKQRQNQ